jgi:hypothetical protein
MAAHSATACWYRHSKLLKAPHKTAIESNRDQVSFPGIKLLGCGVDQSTLSSAKVKERVQLYLYSPSGSSWSVLEWNLPFTFTFMALTVTFSKCNVVKGL